jgi:heme/copper-type cytochrome/quinol oxidase subunit 1
MKRFSLPVLLFGITGLVILFWTVLTPTDAVSRLGPFNHWYVRDTAMDIPIHDTYYVIAWYHVWFLLAMLFLVFAGGYWSHERLTGRRANKALLLIHFTSTLLLPLISGPLHLITASATVPRRYYDYSSFPMFDGAFDLSTLVTAFAFVALIGQLTFVLNVIWFAKRPDGVPA